MGKKSFTLDLRPVMTDFELDYFWSFLEFIKKPIKEKMAELSEDYEKAKKEHPDMVIDEPDYYFDINDHFADLAHEIGEVESLMYNSFCVSIMTFIEKSLAGLCEEIYRNLEQPFKHTEISGSGIYRAKKYILKCLGMNLFSDSNLNPDLEAVGAIRNSIVHNESLIKDENRNKVSGYIERHPDSVTMNELHKITLNEKFSVELLGIAKTALDEVNEAYKILHTKINEKD